MGTLTKDALLQASDLVEQEVELPSIGGSVRVRSLPAAYANQAQSDALEITQDGHGEQRATVNMTKLEAIQVLHGLVEPKLDSVEEAERLAQQVGRAWHKIVETIDAISGIDKASIEDTNARFQPGGQTPAGPSEVDAAGSGNGRSDLPVRAGAGARDASGRTG